MITDFGGTTEQLSTMPVGEYHRSDFVDSVPPVILGAAATRTKNIRLTIAVTVLSAADPVRILQEFATLDLISHGRGEIIRAVRKEKVL